MPSGRTAARWSWCQVLPRRHEGNRKGRRRHERPLSRDRRSVSWRKAQVRNAVRCECPRRYARLDHGVVVAVALRSANEHDLESRLHSMPSLDHWQDGFDEPLGQLSRTEVRGQPRGAKPGVWRYEEVAMFIQAVQLMTRCRPADADQPELLRLVHTSAQEGRPTSSSHAGARVSRSLMAGFDVRAELRGHAHQVHVLGFFLGASSFISTPPRTRGVPAAPTSSPSARQRDPSPSADDAQATAGSSRRRP